jgi:hypothetical protein
MRGEALRGDTVLGLDFEFNIATAFEISHGNAGKVWKGKALGPRIPLECCINVTTDIGKPSCVYTIVTVHTIIDKHPSMNMYSSLIRSDTVWLRHIFVIDVLTWRSRL